MQIKTTLSSRGNDLKDAGPPVDLWKKILGNPYDPDKNPEGVVNLGVAENVIESISLCASLCCPCPSSVQTPLDARNFTFVKTNQKNTY